MDTRAVLKSAYLTSATSYLVFLLLEWLRPGFVTRVFSPHVFLAAVVVFGVLWGRKEALSSHEKIGIQTQFTAVLIGLILAIIVWSEGRSLEEFRILITLAAFFTPRAILHLLHSKF